MRILFDSKEKLYKEPFGCVTPGETCTLRVHVPESVGAVAAFCAVQSENGTPVKRAPMTVTGSKGAYQIWEGSFSLDTPGLYFYHFQITKPEGSFRLFKQGNDTNMEAGDQWQISCIPADFTTPDWAKGAVIYQVFPDRFRKNGDCDLTGKLTPYILHENWDEEVFWQPDEKGEILNNDFFGGNFRGITEKMAYIASLGTTVLYLNPISKSFSSHRYDTGDYKTPDPMLGTEADFARLCRTAHEYGIRVVLDGVYSHTGANSLYFDREGTFGGNGAYCRPDSPYYSWFTFKHYPDDYESWWGFKTLPTVKKTEKAFVEYIITGEDSVVAHWLRLGADGFRLDVADELPNEFVSLLKKRIRELKPDALLIGEVWEDASNKISYGVRRRYFADAALDSCMNYPFRTAILKLMRGQDDGRGFREAVMTVAENYPAQVLACNMNLLGSHDTPRILTALADDFDGDRAEAASRFLTSEDRTAAEEKLPAATVLQYALPGAPSVYYGDEAGMEGHKDPFNRRTYPWGKENADLLAHFRALGEWKKNSTALRLGEIRFRTAEDGHIAFDRVYGEEKVRIYVNVSKEPWEIPYAPAEMRHKAQQVAPGWVRLGQYGFYAVRR